MLSDLFNLPEGTTHISKPVCYIDSGGITRASFYSFKYVGSELLVFDTDNENEYPEWVRVDHKFYQVPEVFPIR